MRKTQLTKAQKELKKAFRAIERRLARDYGKCATWCADCISCRMQWALETLKIRLILDFNGEKKPCEHHMDEGGPHPESLGALWERQESERDKKEMELDFFTLLTANPLVDQAKAIEKGRKLLKDMGVPDKWLKKVEPVAKSPCKGQVYPLPKDFKKLKKFKINLK